MPTVAMFQRVMNICARSDSRLSGQETLVEDGIYGPVTERVVASLQDALGLDIGRGTVEPATWNAVSTLARVRTVAVTDLAVETVLARRGERALRAQFTREAEERGLSGAAAVQFVEAGIQRLRREARACREQHDRFVAAGEDPIGLTEVERAYETVRRGLEARSRDGWRVGILRITGHGRPAEQGFAGTLFMQTAVTADTLSFDADDTAEELVETLMVSSMCDAMPRWGCVELHGCNVGARRRVGSGTSAVTLNGPAYVQSFADTVSRPVSASTTGDIYGTLQHDCRYNGPVVSCVPGGGTVQSYFEANPA